MSKTAASVDVLFEEVRIGELVLANRIAFAPCTRQRAHLDGTPTPMMATYYAQRASAGLLISEGISPSPSGNGYLFAPGLYTDTHERAWARVTDAVHQAGGVIFGQIMHVGRLSDPLIQPDGQTPISASDVQPDPTARHYAFSCPKPRRPYGIPRALTTAEVREVIADFADCARRAFRAGFDGVEIHAASGYLPMQFLTSNTNLRRDAYGGGVEGRSRFLLECVAAMQDATQPSFVAVKVSPGWTFHDVFDDDPIETYSYVAVELSKLGIAYLQVGDYGMNWDVYGALRPLFDGPMFGAAGFTRSTAADAIISRGLDMIAFGQALIANPDLVARYRNSWPLNRTDPATYYTQGEEGYTDYPVFADADHASLVPVESRPTPIGASAA